VGGADGGRIAHRWGRYPVRGLELVDANIIYLYYDGVEK